MKKTKKPINKLLEILFIVSAVAVLVYVGLLLAFTLVPKDAIYSDIDGVANFSKYVSKNIGEILSFHRNEVYVTQTFTLGIFAFCIMLCCVIFTVTAFLAFLKSGRKVVWWALIMNYVDLLMYLLFAGMATKYWEIINEANGNILLKVLAIAIMAVASIHFAIAIVTFYLSLAESYNHPKSEMNEKHEELTDEEYAIRIRRIISQEIMKMQPLRITVVDGDYYLDELWKTDQQVQVEEAKEEPVEEPVTPEPEEVKEEPIEQPVAEEEIQPEPVVEQVEEEPTSEEEPQDDADEPLPATDENGEEIEKPEEGGFDASGKRVREPFQTRILNADEETKANYNELRDELLSYGVKSRLSRSGDVFRLHKKKYAKIFLVGKTLKVYLALNPADYQDSTYPLEDVGYRMNYLDIPLLFKVRSQLSVRRCKKLIRDTMEKAGLSKEELSKEETNNEDTQESEE